jgi:hypothetical protein
MSDFERDFANEIRAIANDIDGVVALKNMLDKYNLATIDELKEYIKEQKNTEEDERDLAEYELDDAEEMLQFADSYGLINDPIGDFVDNVIEIDYTRSLGQDDILDIVLVLGVGGPHIELSLREHKVKGWWGSTYTAYPVSEDTANALWDYVESLIPKTC